MEGAADKIFNKVYRQARVPSRCSDMWKEVHSNCLGFLHGEVLKELWEIIKGYLVMGDNDAQLVPRVNHYPLYVTRLNQNDWGFVSYTFENPCMSWMLFTASPRR